MNNSFDIDDGIESGRNYAFGRKLIVQFWRRGTPLPFRELAIELLFVFCNTILNVTTEILRARYVIRIMLRQLHSTLIVHYLIP